MVIRKEVMLTYKLTIFGKLPGTNEYIGACRNNRYAGAKMKEETENFIRFYIRRQIKNKSVKQPVNLRFTWFTANKKRDKDNIAFGQKFIQDALVAEKILSNDGWKEINHFSHFFVVDKDNERVEVEIEECND